MIPIICNVCPGEPASKAHDQANPTSSVQDSPHIIRGHLVPSMVTRPTSTPTHGEVLHLNTNPGKIEVEERYEPKAQVCHHMLASSHR